VRKQTAFRVDEADMKELGKIAEREERSIAFLVRKAIQKFIEEDKMNEPPPPAERITGGLKTKLKSHKSR
jgi:hypothetical protein